MIVMAVPIVVYSGSHCHSDVLPYSLSLSLTGDHNLGRQRIRMLIVMAVPILALIAIVLSSLTTSVTIYVEASATKKTIYAGLELSNLVTALQEERGEIIVIVIIL